MNRSVSLTFDWKDGLLVAFGFAGLCVLLSFLRTNWGVDYDSGIGHVLAFLAIFGPLVARRAIFGSPQLGNLRNSIFFRLLSIVGLLLLFFALGAGAITMSRMSRLSSAKPNFEAEERAIYSPNSGIDFGIEGESDEERERRLLAERAELEARIKKDAAEAEKTWLENDAEQRRINWNLALATMGLMALGSYFLSLRYEKLSPEPSSPKSKS